MTTTTTEAYDITKSPAYQDAFVRAYCVARLEGILGHLGAAAAQRAQDDDKIIAAHIDAALALARDGLRAHRSHTTGQRE